MGKQPLDGRNQLLDPSLYRTLFNKQVQPAKLRQKKSRQYDGW
jgi:hypothetical protein